MFLTPPPRAKIYDYLKEDEEGKETLVVVEIRKASFYNEQQQCSNINIKKNGMRQHLAI